MAIAIPITPSPPEEALKALADSIGHELPRSYVTFASRHDGAHIEENTLVTSDNEVCVRRFIPVSEAAVLAGEVDGFPPRAIPFAEDDCGNYFYVMPEDGAVYFWDHELEGADERVAEDAAALVRKLTPFDPGAARLAPGQVISAWIDPSFKPEF